MKTKLPAIFTCILVTALSSSPAKAEPSADEYFAASKRFEAMAADSLQRKVMPTVADPEVSKLLNTLSDTAILTSRSYKVSEISQLLDICGRANAANMSYALFDFKNQVNPTGSPEAIATQVRALVEENTLRFQDEIATLQPFLLRCVAIQAPLLHEFLNSLPADQITDVRRKGIQQIQNGAASMYQSILVSAGDARVKQSNRSRMVEALAATSESISQMLSLTTRRQLFEIAKSAAEKADKSLRPEIKLIQSSLTNTRCVALCKF